MNNCSERCLNNFISSSERFWNQNGQGLLRSVQLIFHHDRDVYTLTWTQPPTNPNKSKKIKKNWFKKNIPSWIRSPLFFSFYFFSHRSVPSGFYGGIWKFRVEVEFKALTIFPIAHWGLTNWWKCYWRAGRLTSGQCSSCWELESIYAYTLQKLAIITLWKWDRSALKSVSPFPPCDRKRPKQ